MTVLCICSSSLNDIIPVNIIYNNLSNTKNKDTLNIDLINTDNSIISNIFLGENIVRKQYGFLFNHIFQKLLRKIETNDYDLVIKISHSFKAEIIYRFLKIRNKIRTPFKFLSWFKKLSKTYNRSFIEKKTSQILTQLQHYEVTNNLTPIININNIVYSKTFEMVNWVLRSSNKPTLMNKRFCFIYLNNLINTKEENLLKKIIYGLLENNMLVIPIFKKDFIIVNTIVKNLSLKKRELIIDNFIQNNDPNYLFLFLKYSKFVITNDESLKIVCETNKKPCVYHNFYGNEETDQSILRDINLLIN